MEGVSVLFLWKDTCRERISRSNALARSLELAP